MRVVVRSELSRCAPCQDPHVRARWDSYQVGDVVETQVLGRVLAVAVRGNVDDWAAYIGCGTEQEVKAGGHKLPPELAKHLFDDCIFLCGVYRF